MIAELAIGGPLAGALLYASARSAWATQRWPSLGRWVVTPHGRLHVIEGGGSATETAPILLLHGASANAREWLTSITPRLGNRRWAALDRPGLGHSDALPGHTTLAVQANAARTVLDALNMPRVIVVAHSLGCATALRLALDFPDRVAGLVLCAPASHPYPGDNVWHVQAAAHPVLGPIFAWLAVPIFGPPAGPDGVRYNFSPAPAPADYAARTGLGLLFRPWTFRANACQVRATNAEFSAQSQRYSAITAPTWILTADRDRVVSPKLHAEPLARAIPNANLVVLPGAGHMPHQVYPEAVIDAITHLAPAATDR